MDHYKSLELYIYEKQPLDHHVCIFSDYPIIRGCDQTALQGLKNSQADTESCSGTLPMLQSWLFLGALESIRKKRIRKNVISTKFLDELFTDWRASLQGPSTVEKEAQARGISEILSEIQFWCLKLGNCRENGEDLRRGSLVGVRQPPDETINCPRILLAESRTINRGFKGCYTAEGENRLIHRLVAHGWCPSMARYARFFNTKEPAWRSHGKYEAPYEPRHAVLGCNRAYLKQGSIPVIFIHKKFKLVVTNADDVKNLSWYVAFSHVRSDGMGSNTEKAHALGINHIWIDSFCVPKEIDARIQAMIMMNANYKYSAATIVFDSHIRQKYFDVRLTPLEIILLTLVTSPWMQRLWTLPEAALPNCLRKFNTVIQSMSIEVFRLIKRSDLSVPELKRNLDLAEMLHMLRLRNTSRASDEVVAIADLLDLDVKTPLAVKGDLEEQRKLFFQSLGSIPRDIIFTSAPRMASPGFRWAPSSFLASDRVPDVRDASATGNRSGLSRCLGGGGLCGHYQVAQLSCTASLTYGNSVTIQYGDFTKKAVPANKVAGAMEFNAIAMLPRIAGISQYDYSGRLLVGELDVWLSNGDCIEMIIY
ncbi:hypothetical protein F4680DRAFT_471551 [Xylaria scruposa]|nr:hypothetical protein F4680DRAFT_471551 [Xylaria scruposa]